ncbi:MAG: DarT ssDNA thymidine ADP-ribosyltransferase family protein [Nostocales cyanobacterium 94392]|nr:DarT ssDNA thymidine ADP-ribosyltransferase family protein [Nostocales cyanobacterium 94392]
MNNISSNKLSDSPFYINSEKISFIDKQNILASNEYNGLDKLLKIDSENIVFKIDGKPIIIYEPYIDNDELYCYPLNENLKDDSETQQKLFQTMYDKWLFNKPKNIGISATNWVDGDTTLVEYSTKNIQLAIGFSPKKFVYPNEYALSEEKLPDWVEEWLTDDSKYEFLNALGVHTQTSDLVKLRDCLKNKTEIKANLGTISENPDLLINTIRWLDETNTQFRENDTEALQLIRRIYDLVATESSLPLLAIQCVNDNLIFYNFQNHANKKYYIDEQKLEELSQYEIELNSILEIIQSIEAVLIDKRRFPDQFELDSFHSIDLEKKLDIELLSENSQTIQEDYYKVWRIETNNKFQIQLYDGQIPYKLFFEDLPLQSIVEGDIVVTSSKNTIYINSQCFESIDELLEQLINNSNFTVDDLNSFKKAKNLNTEEIQRKLTDEQNNIIPGESYDDNFRINRCKNNDFKENRSNEQLQLFLSKLITSLDKNHSPWKDYIYHFTHVENAAFIIKSCSILPRQKVKQFKDSAGQSLIGRTKDYIKNNFARFYFRPLTPTQWHNELLGSRTNEIHALCPVPIFFRFKLKDVLETHGARCAVSNGNLAADSTHYGNSAEFLDYFDFDNVYNMFGETDYKIASQQEFIVKNGLCFTDSIDFQIICRNTQDKESLINLIGRDSEFINKISIDSSYYNNINSYVKVDKTETSINVSLQLNHNLLREKISLVLRKENFNLKSISSETEDIINIQVDKQIVVEAKTHMKLDFDRIAPFYIYFIEDGKKWLIYQYEN